MIENRTAQIKKLRDETGCGLTSCRKAFEYCDEHPDCSPLGYLHTVYSGVKYENFYKAVLYNTMWVAHTHRLDNEVE